MTDKERILTHIISVYYPKYMLRIGNDNSIEFFNKNSKPKIDDLVLARTSGLHDFTIGYVVDIKSDSEMTIREIGTQRTCNIGNEMFYSIDKEHLYENYLLEGLQYKTYCKVMKAISNVDGYTYRFHSIDFNDNKCTVNLRLIFEDSITKTTTFNYSSKTTIKEIEKEIRKLIK